MKRLITICCFLFLMLPISAQQFKVTRDTIMINPSWLTRDSARCEVQKVVKYHQDYYCLCKVVIPSDTFFMRHIVAKPVYYPKREFFYYMMRIDGKDKSMHPIMLPDSMRAISDCYPLAMFVRRDSLILKWDYSYSDHVYDLLHSIEKGWQPDKERKDYCWDEKHWKWVETEIANDDYYEDRRWLVTQIDVPIYIGTYTLFTDKKRGKKYYYASDPFRCLRKGDSFYMIRDEAIRKIDRVTDGIEYTDGDITDLEENKQYSFPKKIFIIEMDSIQRSLFSGIGYELNEEDKRIGVGNNMLTGWFIGNQMYVLVSSRTGEYIARYDNGQLTKVLDLGFNCRPVHYSSPHPNFLPNHQAVWRYFDYDTHNIIYLSIDRWKIHITYFINNQENVETRDSIIANW